ncbi:TetR/AcrR family transcriptional regulator [Kribbella sp. NPDC056861]|uniref:TetR/AcrR family transcriptional regulator n=1 Tax=Kribbella sp. NPDC056861 TaxID=3154857 RepID=UPI0034440BE8
MTAEDLPRVLQQLWGLEGPARPGPKPTFQLSDIGAAAIKLADTDGLGAVSMSKVAAALGFTTMSLYRYVDSKDELYVVMLEQAFGQPVPVEPGTTWRERITAWAVAFRDAIRRHPWVLQVPITEPPLSPMQLEWMEHGLRAFEDTGLSAADSLSAMILVNIYVRGAGALSVGMTPDAPEYSEANRLYVQRLAMLADPDRYPTIATNLQSRPAADFDVDYDADDFFFGLDTTLDGIEALIARRTTR